MVESADFVLQSVQEVEQDGNALVRIDFAYTPSAPTDNPVRDGFVLLDPSQYWLIREARTQGVWGRGDTGQIIIQNEYAPRDGIPLPRRHRMHWIATGEVHHLTERIFEGWTRASADERDYMLTAFGLPEPSGGRGRPLLWLLGHAIIGVSALMWYLWNRMRRNAGGADQ